MRFDPQATAAMGLWAILSTVAGGATIFVDDDQTTNPADGTSWATAFADLHDALNAAGAGDEVWIAEGVYHPGIASATFSIPQDVQVFGGFDGVNTSFESRDPQTFVTTLTGSGPSGNAWHVVTITNGTAATRLEGVTVEYGRINSQTPIRDGAGIFIVADGFIASPVVADCVVQHNMILASDGTDGNGAGIGMVALDGGEVRAEVWDTRVYNNSSARRGGGVHVPKASTVLFVGCEFDSNTTSASTGVSGGGVFVDGNSYVTFDSCVFMNNFGLRSGGGFGGSDLNASTFVDCHFEANSAGPGGSGGGFYTTSTAQVDVDRCTFVLNVADRDGGGLAVDNANFSVRNSIFNGNSAGRLGGGVKTLTGDVINCTVVHNTSGGAGGGVWARDDVHNTIAWNNTSTGTAQDNVYMTTGMPTTPKTLTYCNVQGGVPAVFGPTSINADPVFLDADGLDGVAGTADDDLRITGSGVSPCLDAGDNSRVGPSTHDVLGRGRFADDHIAADTGVGSGAIVDIGAVEFPCYSYCTGDLNNDGQVNFDDLNRVLANWGRSELGCVEGDVDGAGSVDFEDLNAILSRWGQACSPL